jgi:hypothetical protein
MENEAHESTPDTEATLRRALTAWPELADRIARQLLIVLHSEGLVSIDAVYDEARAAAGQAAAAPADDNPNRPGAAPWSTLEREAVREAVVRHAKALMAPERVQAVIDGVRRREEADGLESIASLPDVSFEVLAATVRRFCQLPRGDERLAPAQTTQSRVALIRSFISDQLEFIAVAKNYLRVTDFPWILDRVIGPAKGQGRIGGKAAGMFLGYRILQGERQEHGDVRCEYPGGDAATLAPGRSGRPTAPGRGGCRSRAARRRFPARPAIVAHK